MKVGDLVRYKEHVRRLVPLPVPGVYLVERVESNNCWVFLFGYETPIQMNLMEVISESR